MIRGTALRIEIVSFLAALCAARIGRAGKNERLRRKNSKLPKNLKTNRLEPYFVRAKEIF
jgi:hypothetical protein